MTLGLNVLDGYWDANANTVRGQPYERLVDGPTNRIRVYLVYVAGNTVLGNGTTWNVGDFAINLTFGWLRLPGPNSVGGGGGGGSPVQSIVTLLAPPDATIVPAGQYRMIFRQDTGNFECWWNVNGSLINVFAPQAA